MDRLPTPVFLGFPCGSAGKESACNVGDLGSIPGLGRFPGEGKGYPLQHSGLENSVDCIVCGVTKSWTRLSDFHSLFWRCPAFLLRLLCLLPSISNSYGEMIGHNPRLASAIFPLTYGDSSRSHHCLSGHEFEQASRDSEEQRSLACCSPWGRKELNVT